MTPEYNAWLHMKTRCYNNKYDHYDRYGGRGIRVCKRWLHSFKFFLKDMGERPSPQHSLDRINYDGIYSPKNCRWATHKEQQNNLSSNRRICYQGVDKTYAEWSRSLGGSQSLVRERIKRGWSEKASVTIKPGG